MKDLIAFLTKIPVHNADLDAASRQLFAFPLVGALVGSIAALAGIGALQLFPAAIAGTITLIALYATVGLLNLDGLADCADGMMAPLDREKKIAAMKDVSIGIGGVFAVVFVVLALWSALTVLAAADVSIALPFLPAALPVIGTALIISEITAKVSMATCISLGTPLDDGLGARFIRNATPRRYGLTLAIAAVAGAFIAGHYALLIGSGVLVGAVLSRRALRHFGGVNGDVIGAANESARALALILWTLVL